MSGKRVLRLLRREGLLAPQRVRGRRRPRPHDGTIIPDGPNLRWGTDATRPSSPDYAYYQQVKVGQGGNRATLAVARKLARRVRHTLASLGDAALAPVEDLAVAEAA